MPSTFFGLNIGANALSSFQTSVNTTTNNIANVETIGYTRQTTNLQASAALRVNARYGSTGTGVQAISITQERDLYYDNKYWENNSSLGKFEQKLYYLSQIEEAIKDDSVQQGFATIFAKMFNSLDTLKTNAADESVRNQFINNAQNLCTYFNAISNNLLEVQKDCNEEIKSTVDSINATAKKIALLNKEINVLELKGGHANELRDERANLIDSLSEICSVEIIEREVQNTYGENLGGTTYTVCINGQILVDGNDYSTLSCVARENKINADDAEGLYKIIWTENGNDFNATAGNASGRLKALFEVRDGNNNENLKGSFKEFAGTPPSKKEVTIENLSNDEINALMLSSEGTIMINDRYYDYTGWEASTDADGKLVDFTFHLKEEVAYAVTPGVTVSVGYSVDAMGVPYYHAQMNEFLRNFTEMFNNLEKSGVTLDGNPMPSFFEAHTLSGEVYGFDMDFKNTTLKSSDDSYYMLTAQTVAIHAESLKNSRIFATTTDITNGKDAYDIIEKLKTLQSDVTMFRGAKASGFLELLISDVSVDTQKTNVFYNNYGNMKESIGKIRTSVSGVDQDEEAINLIKFQNAYNMASKVISVMSEMYDKLINETGV